MVFQDWDEPCHRIFGEFKSKLILLYGLKFLEFDKPFEVHTDANDFSIGKVQMQDGRLIDMRISWIDVKGDGQLTR